MYFFSIFILWGFHPCIKFSQFSFIHLFWWHVHMGGWGRLKANTKIPISQYMKCKKQMVKSGERGLSLWNSCFLSNCCHPTPVAAAMPYFSAGSSQDSALPWGEYMHSLFLEMCYRYICGPADVWMSTPRMLSVFFFFFFCRLLFSNFVSPKVSGILSLEDDTLICSFQDSSIS